MCETKAENLAFVSRTALWPAQKTWSKHLWSCRPFDLWRCGADAWTVWGAAGMRSLEIPVAHLHQASSQPLRSLMFSEKWQPMTTKEEEEKRKTASTASACKEFKCKFLWLFLPLLHVSALTGQRYHLYLFYFFSSVTSVSAPIDSSVITNLINIAFIFQNDFWLSTKNCTLSLCWSVLEC